MLYPTEEDSKYPISTTGFIKPRQDIVNVTMGITLIRELVSLLTHTSLARVIGCHPRTVKRWFSGQYKPSDEHIAKMKQIGIWEAMKTLIAGIGEYPS